MLRIGEEDGGRCSVQVSSPCVSANAVSRTTNPAMETVIFSVPSLGKSLPLYC